MSYFITCILYTKWARKGYNRLETKENPVIHIALASRYPVHKVFKGYAFGMVHDFGTEHTCGKFGTLFFQYNVRFVLTAVSLRLEKHIRVLYGGQHNTSFLKQKRKRLSPHTFVRPSFLFTGSFRHSCSRQSPVSLAPFQHYRLPRAYTISELSKKTHIQLAAKSRSGDTA